MVDDTGKSSILSGMLKHEIKDSLVALEAYAFDLLEETDEHRDDIAQKVVNDVVAFVETIGFKMSEIRECFQKVIAEMQGEDDEEIELLLAGGLSQLAKDCHKTSKTFKIQHPGFYHNYTEKFEGIERLSLRLSNISDIFNNEFIAKKNRPKKQFQWLSIVEDVKLNLKDYDLGKVTFPEKRLSGYGDRKSMFHVLNNLVKNAILHGSNSKLLKVNVEISVEQLDILRKRFPMRIPLVSHKYKIWNRLTVSDNGKGIPEDKIENIFKPYVSLDENGNESVWESEDSALVVRGMGLYVVKTVVENHNGLVFAFNKISGGATFVVLIPFVREDEN